MRDKYDYVKRRIDMADSLSEIARRTKISRRTLQNLRSHTYEARYDTINRLYTYFKEGDSK